jgi:tetratricopeptide (TPR) repeat protein
VECFDDSRAVLEQVLERDPGNWKARRELAIVHCSLGNTFRTHDELTEERFNAALSNYQSAAAIFAGLAESNPELDDIKRRQAYVCRSRGALCRKAGDVRISEGNPGEALRCYQQSRAAYEQAAEVDSSNVSAALESVALKIAVLNAPAE